MAGNVRRRMISQRLQHLAVEADEPALDRLRDRSRQIYVPTGDKRLQRPRLHCLRHPDAEAVCLARLELMQLLVDCREILGRRHVRHRRSFRRRAECGREHCA